MTESILSFLTTNSVNELRSNQNDGSVVKNQSRVSNEVLLTIAAIKVLNEKFIANKKIWMLVEMKARKFILKQGQLDRASLDQVLNTFAVTVKDFKE